MTRYPTVCASVCVCTVSAGPVVRVGAVLYVCWPLWKHLDEESREFVRGQGLPAGPMHAGEVPRDEHESPQG